MPTNSRKDSYKRPKIKDITNPTVPSKILVVMLVLAALALFGALAISLLKPTQPKVDSSTYQVVFLSDRQVYFGKLKNINDPYVVLEDVYQVNNQSQDASAEEPQFSLTKHSSQFYAPEDTMFISRDKIVSWNNLKSDSQIIQAIANLENGD